MHLALTHPWAITEAEAIEFQQTLAHRVETSDRVKDVALIAGVDVGYHKHSDKLIAAVVVLDAATHDVVESVAVEDVARFPYIPGLFSFREIPPLVKALKQLKNTPDLIICDGQGLAHPRRFGLACHLGVLFDIPTIGCGKTRLLGEHSEPDSPRGSSAPLTENGEVIGCALRTQAQVKHVYVSIGHRVALSTACDWVLKLSPKYRLPETTRLADQLVRAVLSGRTSLTAP